MKKGGWFAESFRHGMAARGIKTGKNYFKSKRGYFADANLYNPSDKTKIERVRAAAQLPKVEESIVRAEREGQKMIARAEAGDVSAFQVSVEKKQLAPAWLQKLGIGMESVKREAVRPEGVSDQEWAALQATADETALRYALKDLPIPENVKANMTPAGKASLDKVLAQKKYEERGAISRVRDDIVDSAIAGAEEKLIGGLERAGRKIEAEEARIKREQEMKERSLEGVTWGQVNPFFRGGIQNPATLGEDSNIFLGANEAEGFIGRFTAPFNAPNLPTQTTSDFRGPSKDGESIYDKRITREVEALYAARDELGTVDTKPYQEAVEAFKKGRREKLISAINKQEAELEKQRSRWKLVDQTRSLVESEQNREGALDDEPGILGIGTLGFFGPGSKLAKQTQKIHEVRAKVKDGADKASNRAAVMRSMLKTMDSKTHVEFKSDVPAPINPISEEGGARVKLSIPNPYDGVEELAKKIKGVQEKRVSKEVRNGAPKVMVSRELLLEAIEKGPRGAGQAGRVRQSAEMYAAKRAFPLRVPRRSP